jgi:hypothetical protein
VSAVPSIDHTFLTLKASQRKKLSTYSRYSRAAAALSFQSSF